MLSFKNFLLEVARSPERAVKLLHHLYHNKGYGIGYDENQMHNLIPLAHKRPNCNFQDFDYVGKLKDVPVKSLISGQRTVSRDVVEKKLKGEWKDHDPEYPYVVHHAGVHYMIDGNHRGNQAILAGETHMKAMVVDANPTEDHHWHHYPKAPNDH